jgi:hypothetical protein
MHFGMVEGELVIEAATANMSEVYQLIPHMILEGDLPHFLVLDYFHWLRLPRPESCKEREISIEFRPRETPWESSNQNWYLNSFSTGDLYLEKPSGSYQVKRLVDIRSHSFRMFAERLKPLEKAEYISMTIDTGISEGYRIIVELLRYRLTFRLNDECQLESCDLREMIIDDSPSGSLFGLRNQLILKPKNPLLTHLARDRCVLIPYGRVAYQSSAFHMDVTIDTGDDRDVRYFKYDIDTNLGYLASQSLEADYYKIHLHAITGHCLPDPLTGRTGIEEALSELSSAKCQSFQLLEERERDLLFLIASLTPARSWYPEHLQVMQVVQWNNGLSPLSQHPGFFTVSRDILDYAKKLVAFWPEKTINYDFSASENLKFAMNNHLRDRAALRTSHFFNAECSNFGKADSHDDTHFQVDDRIHNKAISPDAAAETSVLIQEWSVKLDTTPDLWSRLSDKHLLCDA